MKARIVRKPKYMTEPNPPNRRGISTPGPLRFATGPHAGKVVPTRAQKVRVVVCERCKLPSHSGLRPFVKALGFDRKTGKAIEQYVHDMCPKDVAKNKALIEKFARERAKRAAELVKLPQHKTRKYDPRRFR